MSKQKIFNFLTDLRANNDKAWMDENRERYHEAKAIWLAEVATYLDRLKQHDPELAILQPRQTIMRINRNNVFHPEKPTYKDSFAFAPYKGGQRPEYYLHLSPGNSFVAAGVWQPSPEKLAKIREAIDYDASELREIIAEPDFAAFYGGLDDDPDALKTSPRNYPKDHPAIDLLRRKNFTVTHQLTRKEILRADFVDTLEKGFLLSVDYLNWFRRALDFEE